MNKSKAQRILKLSCWESIWSNLQDSILNGGKSQVILRLLDINKVSGSHYGILEIDGL